MWDLDLLSGQLYDVLTQLTNINGNDANAYVIFKSLVTVKCSFNVSLFSKGPFYSTGTSAFNTHCSEISPLLLEDCM